MRRLPILLIISLLVTVAVLFSCTEQKKRVAPAINENDSLPNMITYGINMTISDSGVIKYRIISERCITNQNLHPKRSIFDKGIFFIQFDEQYHIHAYIQADTAYHYDEKKIYELRGRVRILTKDGVKYHGEELFWDQEKHEYYSHKYSVFETPIRKLEGTNFWSNEQMTQYHVSQGKGWFERADMVGEDTVTSQPDTVKQRLRTPERPRAKGGIR